MRYKDELEKAKMCLYPLGYTIADDEEKELMNHTANAFFLVRG